MRNVPEIRPYTVVQEVMEPARMVRELIGSLVVPGMGFEDMRMRTTTRRVLEASESGAHPRIRYAEELRWAETLVQALARQALQLSGEIELIRPKYATRPSRIYFSPRSPAHLGSLVSALQALPSIEPPKMELERLYIEMPAGTMTHDRVHQQDVIDELGERSRHPATSASMYVTNPQIVMRDVSLPILHHPHILPDDD